MSDNKEFQGKTLDDAILAACEYYGVEREKLDIEIMNDAKTGIFGLVSVKKACIRVARVQVADLLDSGLTALSTAENKGKGQKAKPAERSEASRPSKSVEEPSGSVAKPKAAPKKPVKKTDEAPRPVAVAEDREALAAPIEETSVDKEPVAKKAGRSNAEEPNAALEKEASRPSTRGKNLSAGNRGKERPASQVASTDGESMSELDLSLVNAEEFVAAVHDTVTTLVRPIVGDVNVQVTVQPEGAVKVTVECEESSGLLVGREGQTLAAVQYVAARVISKKYDGAVRLQIDAGNYRERQEEKLKELAIALAGKARATGKVQSTRPLSAYQRRIVHLTLETENDIHTSSKGDGPQRRVIIQIRKDNGASKTRPATDASVSGPADSAVD